MSHDLRPIIADIASEADAFLAGVTDRAQARAGLEEFITMEYGEIAAAERKLLIDGVMGALEAEEFFGTEFVGDAFRDDEEPADE